MDLIDRDALCEAIYKWIPKGTMITNDDVINVLMAIEKAPTVDAVEVVWCDKCRRSHEYDRTIKLVYCTMHGMTKFRNDFCSYGNRRDGD